jgi:hypothetical protein
MPSQTNLNLSTQPTGPVECLGQTFPSEEARREHYLKLLAEKLKDPEFRKIEGFPIGEDEDILALSDPPYYTACPNPWIGDFIQHYGRLYDPKEKYHREPFAADVSEGKNHPIYNAHSYHTKVPHRAIMRYILHYTEPGDVVFDGFCGTGMTGVAAQLCGDRKEVQELGYRVDDKGIIFDEVGKAVSKLGARRAVLNDLSPAASFIAYNYNTPEEAAEFEVNANALLRDVERELGWIYTTLHSASELEINQAVDAIAKTASPKTLQEALEVQNVILEKRGRINYAVWSDVFRCPECASEVNFWEQGVKKSSGEVLDAFPCQHCGAHLTKRNAKQAETTVFDGALNRPIKQTKQTLVLINYTFAGKRYEKNADAFDKALVEKIESFQQNVFFPTERMPEGDESRRNDPAGITHVHHFYTKRNLWLLSVLLSRSKHHSLICALLDGHSVGTKMSRFRASAWASKSTGPMKGNTAGTLYVPSLIGEQNWLNIFKEKIAMIRRAYFARKPSLVTTGSAFGVPITESELDYVFLDPPFGSNLMYSELNFLWESWLRVWTNVGPETIENKTQSKDLDVYRQLMAQAFKTAFSSLKPGRWMTVEFSNTKAAVWNAIQSSLQEAGFVVANVASLDKQQGSFKAVTTSTAVKQDLVISAYKPNGGLEDRFRKSGHTVEGVWDFMRTHLRNLPILKPKGGELEFIAERDPRILYDRMVAFYVGHGVPVPLSSAEFQRELADKFPEREGMFFLSEQVAEFDKKRAQMEGVGQMSIFVEDEKSAIDWLRGFLKNRPSTYQDIHPEFMQQLSASWKKFEARPELRMLLEQNFLQYKGHEGVPSQIHSYLSTQNKDLRNLSKDDPRLQARAKDRWYVPDPAKAVDVEQLRNRRLLEEFWTLCDDAGIARPKPGDANQPALPIAIPSAVKKGSRKKAKEVRTEAVRTGFKECFARKDYGTILAIAQHLPDNVIEEDEQLQMIHDMAEMRAQG